MSAANAYFARMIEKTLRNWGDVKNAFLRDESPDRDNWVIEVKMNDGRELVIYVKEITDDISPTTH